MTDEHKDWKTEVDGIKVDPHLEELRDVEDIIAELRRRREDDEEVEKSGGPSIDDIENAEEENTPLIGEVPPDELEVKSEDDVLDEIAQFIVDNPDYTDDDIRDLAEKVSISLEDLREMLSPDRLEKARRNGNPRTEEERRERHSRLHPGGALPERGSGRFALTRRDGTVFKWFKDQREMNDYMRNFTQYAHATPFNPGGLVWMVESISIDRNDTDTLSKLASVDSYDDWRTVLSTIRDAQNPSVDLLFSNTTTLRLSLGDVLDLQKGNRLTGSQDEKFELMEVELLEKGSEDLESEYGSSSAIVSGSHGPGPGDKENGEASNLLRIDYVVDKGRYELWGMNKQVLELDVYSTNVLRRGIYSIHNGEPSSLSYTAGLV